MNVVKNMTHIWVGPRPAPTKWMRTWQEKHPDWNYKVFTDEMLKGRKWYNQHLIEEYYSRGNLPGVADLIRYEILYEEGGYLPPADSVCFHNVEELLCEPAETAYSVYESETEAPGFFSPIHSCNPENTFVKLLLDTLHKLEAVELNRFAYKSTGNAWLAEMKAKHNPTNLHIFPSHYFIPWHFRAKDKVYKGSDKVYCEQMFGSTSRGVRYTMGE